MRRYWPATAAEWDRLHAEAVRKYAPLVARLQPYELSGLAEAVQAGVDALRVEAEAEDVRRGYRPPGTRVGR